MLGPNANELHVQLERMKRRTLFLLHNRAGLALLVLVFVVAGSGGLLSFRASFRPAEPVATESASPRSLEELVAIAQAEGGGAPATDIRLAQSPEQPYLIWLDDEAQTEVFLDRGGKVLAVRSGRDRLTAWLFRLHTGSIAGTFGEWVVAGAALGLWLLGATGFFMWWSRRRPKRAADADRG